MKCPRCHNTTLEVINQKGIEVDKCSQCGGLWLDHHELDQLEDLVLAEDHLKGSMVYSSRESEISCPKCQAVMTTFNYRAYDLPIDLCKNGHGFWLDKGEDVRVMELMEKRIHDLKRSMKAEGEWGAFLKKLNSKQTMPSRNFINRVKAWFTGKS